MGHPLKGLTQSMGKTYFFLCKKKTVFKNDRSPSSDEVRSSYFDTFDLKYSILGCIINIGRSYVGFSQFGLKVLSGLDSGSISVIYDENQGFIM